MTPALTRSGLLIAGTGIAFVVSGACTAAWPLVALGAVVVCTLLALNLLFVPTSAVLRRRQLEFTWWVPGSATGGGALVADRPLTLRILLRNQSALPLTFSRVRVLASSAIELHEPSLSALLPARHEICLTVTCTPRAAGYWFFHGISVQITDRLGFFALHLYYRNLMDIKVFPPLAISRAAIPFRPRTGTLHERAGLHTLRQTGLGSDLREIREHIPGDPFKRMAWKATARLHKLMVREFESEIMVTHWLLLDISATMRDALPGRSKLDYGMALCAGFARLALDAGDRVGLITFDDRVYSQLLPSDGSSQLHQIISRLMELHAIVDEDLTDLTDAELHAAVAEYLRFQEGVDVQRHLRLPAPKEDFASGLLVGPHGEIYDARAMDRAVEQALGRRPPAAAGGWHGQVRASSERSARLRRFCRLCGLELPYRQASYLTGKERGLTAALRTAGAARQSQFIVLVSDLENIAELQPVVSALRLARRRGHSLAAVAPFSPAFHEPQTEAHAQRVQNILALRATRQRRSVQQAIARLGVPVLSASPEDVLHQLMRRLAQLRVLRTGS